MLQSSNVNRETPEYGLSRTLRVVLDLLTVKFLLYYSTRPIHVFGTAGLGTGGAGAVMGALLTVQRLLLHRSIADRPLLQLAVLLVLVGVQLVTIGLLSELMTRTYYETQRKPIYVVREE